MPVIALSSPNEFLAMGTEGSGRVRVHSKARENGERYALLTARTAKSSLTQLRINCTVQITEMKSFHANGQEQDDPGIGAERPHWLRQALAPSRRGAPLARDREARHAAPEPEVLRVIGEESKRKGTDKLASRQIDQVIKSARAEKPQRG